MLMLMLGVNSAIKTNVFLSSVNASADAGFNADVQYQSTLEGKSGSKY